MNGSILSVPCPFCASPDLRLLDITIEHDDKYENIEAVECNNCGAQARKDRWGNRPKIQTLALAKVCG